MTDFTVLLQMIFTAIGDILEHMRREEVVLISKSILTDLQANACSSGLSQNIFNPLGLQSSTLEKN